MKRARTVRQKRGTGVPGVHQQGADVCHPPVAVVDAVRPPMSTLASDQRPAAALALPVLNFVFVHKGDA